MDLRLPRCCKQYANIQQDDTHGVCEQHPTPTLQQSGLCATALLHKRRHRTYLGLLGLFSLPILFLDQLVLPRQRLQFPGAVLWSLLLLARGSLNHHLPRKKRNYGDTVQYIRKRAVDESLQQQPLQQTML